MNTTVTEQSRAELDPPYFVYIMTNARCGPYRIGIAAGIKAIDYQRVRFMRQSCGLNPPEPRDIFLSVWYEECINEFSAQKRADEIELMPYLWQRRLIELVNPQWLDYTELGLGFPYDWLYVVPEIPGMHFRKLSEL